MKTIKKDETYEPKIGEIFMLNGKKIKCDKNTTGENTCCECCLLNARCLELNCADYIRTDEMSVHFIEIHENEKKYQAVVNGSSFSKIYKNIEELKNNLVLKAGDRIEIKETKVIETIVVKDVNNEIDTYEKALEYIKDENDGKRYKLDATIHQLLTIAEAWNKADGFVININDKKQNKWFPVFKIREDGRFIVEETLIGQVNVTSNLGGRLCFKSSDRAKQFGTQFIDLWNDFLLIK